MKSIIEEQADWTMRDWEVAAGILGDQARFLVRLLTTSKPPSADCTAVELWQTAQGELERVIVHLTQEAAHCASKAESEAEKLARFLGARVDMAYVQRLTRDCQTYDRR